MISYLVAGGADGNPTNATCGHLDRIADVTPSTTQGCEDCLREGTQWVHCGSASSAATWGAATTHPDDMPPDIGRPARTH